VQLIRRSAPASLAAWASRPFSPGVELGLRATDHCDSYERVVGREPPGEALTDGPFRHAADAILRYDIFPPSRLARLLAREPVEVGDAVGARYHIAPGLDLVFASRVVDVFDAVDVERNLQRAGFTYRTLAGHPELGEETFSVEKDLESGAVTVALRSWSRPGHLLTRIGWRIARRIQVGASRDALAHLEHAAQLSSLATQAADH
jgi:uncharacterized protein (UPF0548 family)